MTAQTKQEILKVECRTDKPVAPAGKEWERILEINLTPAEITGGKRAGLNLSLVIDRSGSMQGEKLHYVKMAAAHVMDLLTAEDRAAIVTYDDVVAVPFPSALMDAANRQQARAQIQAISAGNSTYLSGGWLKGCEQVAEASRNGSSVNRTLLLTDGLANVGITDIDTISTQCRELANRGVSTSCFGVGLGYNEHMLEAMANSGGGNFHFLEAMNAIPLVFEREFQELINITVRDVCLSLRVPAGMSVEASAGWQVELDGDRWIIRAGSLVAGKTRSLFMKLRCSGLMALGELSIPITVRGKDATDQTVEVCSSIYIRTVSADEDQQVDADRELLGRFALIDMADKTNEALRLERIGECKRASELLEGSLNFHAASMPAPMIDKFHFLSRNMKTGLSEEERKRHHREEYDNKRGRSRIRDYALQIRNGHLLFVVDGEPTLLDTGVPVSFGKEGDWYFMNETHHLAADYLGVTPELIASQIHTSVDRVVGCDILKKFHVTLNVAEGRLHFSEDALYNYDHSVTMQEFMGVPFTSVDVAGENSEMFIDSGAQLSYVSQKLAAGFPKVGRQKDFYPGFGEFETDVFQVEMTLDGHKFSLRCGQLPNLLEMSLLVIGKTGILGVEFFENHRVDLAFPEGIMRFTKSNK